MGQGLEEYYIASWPDPLTEKQKRGCRGRCAPGRIKVQPVVESGRYNGSSGYLIGRLRILHASRCSCRPYMPGEAAWTSRFGGPFPSLVTIIMDVAQEATSTDGLPSELKQWGALCAKLVKKLASSRMADLGIV